MYVVSGAQFGFPLLLVIGKELDYMIGHSKAPKAMLLVMAKSKLDASFLLEPSRTPDHISIVIWRIIMCLDQKVRLIHDKIEGKHAAEQKLLKVDNWTAYRFAGWMLQNGLYTPAYRMYSQLSTKVNPVFK